MKFHETRRKIICEWTALPKDKRQTEDFVCDLRHLHIIRNPSSFASDYALNEALTHLETRLYVLYSLVGCSSISRSGTRAILGEANAQDHCCERVRVRPRELRRYA